MTLVHEPEFLPEDTDGAISLVKYEAELCRGCGHPRSETMDPDNQGEYEATPLECFACSAAERRTSGWSFEERRGVYVSTQLPQVR